MTLPAAIRNLIDSRRSTRELRRRFKVAEARLENRAAMIADRWTEVGQADLDFLADEVDRLRFLLRRRGL